MYRLWEINQFMESKNITTMQNNFKYINLSWAVVGICENARQPLLVHIPGIDKDEAAAVEHYVIGYMAFWHIAFVDEDCLVPCNDDALRNDARRKIDRYIADALRNDARRKIDRYIADHPPVETFPRFYLVLLRQPIAPMESDGMSRVYQM